MSKRICLLVSFIPLILRAWIVWHLCPDNKATRVTHFNVAFLRLSSSLGPRVFMKSRTVVTFQMLLYLCRVGLESNTPFISLVTKGWFPNVFLFGSSITVERAYLAVFKELYVNPRLYCVTKKINSICYSTTKGINFPWSTEYFPSFKVSSILFVCPCPSGFEDKFWSFFWNSLVRQEVPDKWQARSSLWSGCISWGCAGRKSVLVFLGRIIG